MNFDLNINKPKSETRVVVAMSGGVDSSVVAALMAECGYETIGITLQLYDHGEAIKNKKACCAGRDIRDARRVAEEIGIPHYVLDYETVFRQRVIDDFADSYMRGETPIPCVRCNQSVKFSDLFSFAKKLNADALVTGHYVQRFQGNERVELHKAIDPTRDQSYFLFATTQEQLDFLHFPLGGVEKTVTRDLAKKYGLIVSDKPDSQDICFVPNGNYADLVSKLRPGALDAGDIIHIDGTVMGKHNGIIHFTIGQRRGLNISHSEPLYVVKIDAKTKAVYVGPKEALAQTEINVKELNWLTDINDIPKEGLPVAAKIRSTRPPKQGRVFLDENDKVKLVLDEPEYGVAAGQACVFYDENRVLGGGWIYN